MDPFDSFDGVLESGHKEHAVEVPFDPEAAWGMVAQPFAPGRLGLTAMATVNGVDFATHVVKRAGHHWVLVDPALAESFGLVPGSRVTASVRPR